MWYHCTSDNDIGQDMWCALKYMLWTPSSNSLCNDDNCQQNIKGMSPLMLQVPLLSVQNESGSLVMAEHLT